MNNPRANAFDNLLELQTARSKPATATDEEAERFFGFVVGAERAHNLELRMAAGPWPFREYSYLIGGELIHAGEFILRFATGERVTVKGRHLRPLFDKILRHRATWFREGDDEEKVPDGELFVDEILGPVKEDEGELP
jgi:hypothetical protein